MSYSGFIFEEAGIPRDAIPYVIVGQGAINMLATVIAVCAVLPAKSDSDIIFVKKSYQGLRIDRSLVY